MRMTLHIRIVTILQALIGIAVASSCTDNMEYSSDSRDCLEFSCDTLDMDSVFAGMVSATKRLVVYNREDRALRFDVELAGGYGSPFQLVADGQDGIKMDGLEVGAKDSMICFIRVFPPIDPMDPFYALADSLSFSLESGIVQSVQLRATSVTARKWTGVCLWENFRMDAEFPYLIYDSLYVAPGVRLEMAPGTRLFFHNGAFLKSDGQVLALGTPDSQIVFGGDRIDRLLDDLPYSLLDSQWKGVLLGSEAGNRFEHCVIRGGEFGLHVDSSDCSTPALDLVSSVVHNVSGNCIENAGSWIRISNCQITNAGEYCLDSRGGRVDAVFSTFASLSLWNQGVAAVRIGDGASKDGLLGAVFQDCIITGRHNGEFAVADSVAEKYSDRISVSASLVLAKDSTASYFHNVTFENVHMERYGADNFTDRSRRGYDCVFSLDSISRARGIADSLSLDWPVCLAGLPRPAVGADAGCYQSSFAQ